MASIENGDGEYAERNFSGEQTGKARYWISFDLGLTGDFSKFYEWLDMQNAEECGFGTAAILSDKSLDEVITEVREVLKETPRARAYILSKRPDGKFGGKFIVGGRKKAPWTGYAIRTSDQVEYA